MEVSCPVEAAGLAGLAQLGIGDSRTEEAIYSPSLLGCTRNLLRSGPNGLPFQKVLALQMSPYERNPK